MAANPPQLLEGESLPVHAPPVPPGLLPLVEGDRVAAHDVGAARLRTRLCTWPREREVSPAERQCEAAVVLRDYLARVGMGRGKLGPGVGDLPHPVQRCDLGGLGSPGRGAVAWHRAGRAPA